MNAILFDVITAINNIEREYYEMQKVSFKNGILESDSDEDLKNYERRFMIEFAIQYSKLIEGNRKELYTGTQADFEIPKEYIFYGKTDEEIQNTFNKLSKKEYKSYSSSKVMSDYITTIPDFLIHKEQNNRSADFQKLIIEAKTNPSPSKIEILKDIFHINIYAENYNYQNCVILLINYPKSKWLKDLRSYLANQYYLASSQRQKRIYVVFKENFEAEPSVHSLIDLKTICQQPI